MLTTLPPAVCYQCMLVYPANFDYYRHFGIGGKAINTSHMLLRKLKAVTVQNKEISKPTAFLLFPSSCGSLKTLFNFIKKKAISKDEMSKSGF